MTQTSDKVTLKYMSTDDLVPYIYNPRDNEQAVEAVAESIRNFGFKVPIIIDAVGEIVTGHTRLKAAKRLGIKKVPVIIADDLDEDQVRAFRLADNKVGELAEWDNALLMAELAMIDLDMEQFGFDVDDLLDEAEDLLADDEEVEEDDADLELQDTTIKVGDIFQLGRHRLACGDSTDREHIAKLLNGSKIDTVYTLSLIHI